MTQAATADPPTATTVGVDATRRVLAWSGTKGWRSTRPSLTPRVAWLSARDDAGFSMVELMVVLLVIGILLAIAVPTFLGTTNAADDRSAQSNLSTALTDARTQFEAASQTYFIGGVQDAAGFVNVLTAAQLSLTFLVGSAGTTVYQGGSAGPTVNQGSSGSLSVVSVSVSSDGNGLVLGAYSLPGNCFYVVDNAGTLSPAAQGFPPYTGTTPITTTATPVPPGTHSIALPTATGTNYVEVKGDQTKSDCNAYSPEAAGPSTTVQYLRAGFPN
ncbi:MAG TPA: type II secretion system protein [Acidimicrobiales bacterium]